MRLIFGAFAKLRARGLTILIVEQMARLGLEICDRAHVLETGRIAIWQTRHRYGGEGVRRRTVEGRSSPETASRVRGRIEAVLSWSNAKGLRARGENPAQWRGHLDQLLPAPTKVRPVKHHPALPYDGMPALMAELRHNASVRVRALEFLILTASRTVEALRDRLYTRDPDTAG